MKKQFTHLWSRQFTFFEHVMKRNQIGISHDKGILEGRRDIGEYREKILDSHCGMCWKWLTVCETGLWICVRTNAIYIYIYHELKEWVESATLCSYSLPCFVLLARNLLFNTSVAQRQWMRFLIPAYFGLGGQLYAHDWCWSRLFMWILLWYESYLGNLHTVA